MFKSLKLLLSLVLLVSLTSCGGGGGDGDSFLGAATLRVDASPRTVDTGDRTKVTVIINDVHEDGIILKILFPDGLTYVLDSSFLIVDEKENDIGPAFNGVGDDGIFLVYFLSQDQFDDNFDGVLTFELEGVTGFSQGTIEVDSDVDDPLINNSEEFDVNAPEFLGESSVSIEVKE